MSHIFFTPMHAMNQTRRAASMRVDSVLVCRSGKHYDRRQCATGRDHEPVWQAL